MILTTPRINIYLLLLVFGYVFPVFSQDLATISGIITDAPTRKPLANANLMIEELNRGGISDSTGYFSFSNVPEGEFTISAGYVGYRVYKQHISTINEPKILLKIILTPVILTGQTIEVTSTRALEGESPVAFSNVTREDLDGKYTSSDIPMMLDDLPGIYSYSLTGDNLGYSFLKIRGFDQSRVGVMINDIPLNDPEDQQVYWVDHPDLAESVEDIQVQRGVGSSIYGTSTFGGSVNINTKNYSSERTAKITIGGGSYQTRKLMVEYKSGLVQNTYGFYGRFSNIKSDGYRKHSSSDLLSYFLGLERYDHNMVTRINIMDGHERTHPDWDGVPEDILISDRKYKKETYENAVDDFSQPQIQLINDWQINTNLDLSNTFYMIHGKGYYENLKINKNMTDYGMENFDTSDPGLFGADSLSYYQTANDSTLFLNADGKYVVQKTDLTRQKWVDKYQYGWIGKFTIALEEAVLTLGSALYYFESDHHGNVLWARNLPYVYDPERKYYKYDGEKTNISLYANYLADIYPQTKLLINMLYEHKNYSFKQQESALFIGDLVNHYDVTYNFYSPRVGLNYLVSDGFSIYGNLSYAQREPSDNELYDTWTGPDDLGARPLFAQNDTVRSNGQVAYIKWQNPLVESESVVDYEAGISYNLPEFSLKANFYYMDFANEIVPLGSIDKDGNPVKGNADKTIHSGLELSAAYKWPFAKLNGNLAWSNNYYQKFYQANYAGGADDFSGNSIAGFPGIIGNLSLTGIWRQLSSSLFLKYVGKQYLDNTQNDDRTIDPFTRIDMMIDYRLPDFYYFPEIRFIVKITNLLDEEYETAGYYDSWAETAYFYPAANRNYYFAVSFSL